MIRALSALARQWLSRLPPESAHRAAIAALKFMPRSPTTAPDYRLAVDAFDLHFAHPVGLAAGIRQERRGSGSAARARLFVRRSGNLDAASASRQRQAAAVSAARRRRPRQPDGLQQRWFRGGARPTDGACQFRHPRCQFRPQQGRERSHRGLRPGREDLRRRRELVHDQCFLAQHGRPPRSAAPRCARRTRGAGHRGARGGPPAPPGADQDRARPRLARARRHRRSGDFP